MTVASEKIKRASARWMLVRIKPARHVSTLLASEGGGVYSLTFNGFIASVERNGTTLTETTGTPGTNDFWSHDESNGSFKVKLASAPSATTNIIIIRYYLFYTTGEGQHTYETPTDSTSALRVWEPRIVDPPVIKISFENQISGVLTISDTSIEVANADNDFQQYLTANDSFNFADVNIWTCINSNQNIDFGYVGRVRTVSLSGLDVQISINDIFSNLKKPAYFGDLASEALVFPSDYLVKPAQAFKPVPMIFSHQTRGDSWNDWGQIETTGKYGRTLNASDWIEAINIDYFPGGGRTKNRDYILCRVPAAGVKVQTFGTLSRVITRGSSFYAFFTATNLETGMQVSWTNGGTRYHGVVVRSEGDSWTYSSNTYNVCIQQTTGIGVFPDTEADILATDVFDALTCVNVAHNATDSGRFEALNQISDFTINVSTTTENGNVLVKLILNDNMEATPETNSELRTVNPETDVILFKLWVDDDAEFNHADVIRDLCTSCNLTIDTASITAAAAALDIDTSFQIPFENQSEYDEMLFYIQELLSSTLGYIALTSDGTVVYKLIDAITTTDLTVLEEKILSKLNADIDYESIYTKLILKNDYSHKEDTNYPYTVNGQNTEVENVLSERLYGVDRTKEVNHLLRYPIRSAEILEVISNPLITYSFSTATENIDSRVGDDITVVHNDLLGTETSIDLKIISIDRSIEKTTIRAAAILE